jgi:hypothetical protein
MSTSNTFQQFRHPSKVDEIKYVKTYNATKVGVKSWMNLLTGTN